MVSALAAGSDASEFRSGRDFATWLGPVPRQHSSGRHEKSGGTPNFGIEMSDDNSRYYRIGWRLTAADPDESGFLLTADITRQESVADADPEHGLKLQVGFRF